MKGRMVVRAGYQDADALSDLLEGFDFKQQDIFFLSFF